MTEQEPRVRKTLANDCPAPDPVQARRILALLGGREPREVKPVPRPQAMTTSPDAAAS